MNLGNGPGRDRPRTLAASPLRRVTSPDIQWLSSFNPPYNPVREGEVVLYDSRRVGETVVQLQHSLCAFLRERQGELTPVFVGLAEGGLWLTQQLLDSEDTRRALGKEMQLCLIDAKRYSGQEASHSSTTISPRLVAMEAFQSLVRGRDVVIIDDMLDEGRSVVDVADFMRREGAESCHCVVFAARHSLSQYEAIAPLTIGKPLILEEDFHDVRPWVFGCGPDWGKDDLGPEAKRLSRYRAEISEASTKFEPVMVAFESSMRR